MVEEINKYALQIGITKSMNLSKAELEQFIGILLLMSIVEMPSTRDIGKRAYNIKQSPKLCQSDVLNK